MEGLGDLFDGGVGHVQQVAELREKELLVTVLGGARRLTVDDEGVDDHSNCVNVGCKLLRRSR